MEGLFVQLFSYSKTGKNHPRTRDRSSLVKTPQVLAQDVADPSPHQRWRGERLRPRRGGLAAELARWGRSWN